MPFRRWLTLLLLPIALLLPGCNSAMLRTQAAQVPQLVLTTLGDPKTFNPALNQEFPNIFLFCFRGLTRENGITGSVDPDLAESWQFSDDGLRLTFTLREGLRWSDGQPLTVEDVIFSYRDIVFNDKIPTDIKDGFRIGDRGLFPDVRQVSDRQVEFILPEPFAPILHATTGGGMGANILPKHILQESVRSIDSQGKLQFLSTWTTEANPENIVVNGPYRIEQYRPGERIIFRRNPYYWEKDVQGQPLPQVERIVWQVAESTDTQLLSFRSGELDIIGDVRPLRPEYFSLLKREENRGQFQVYVGGPWSGTTFMLFNLNQAKTEQGEPLVNPIKSRWFNEVRFRQAVAYAIDRPRMINNLYRGISQPQDSPISVQSPYYLSPQEGLKTYEYNLDEARKLLLEAGFQYNAQGQLLDADGNRVRFTLNTNAGNELREAIGSQIKVDLSKIGIQVDFTPITFNTLISKLTNTRDWEAAMLGFTGSVEPHSGANLWTSQGGSHMFNLGSQPGQPPIQGWLVSDWEKEIDRLFQAGARELNEAKRKEIYGDFQRITQEQLPVIHLVHEIALMAARDRVQGLQYSGLPTWGLWNIQELKVEDEQ